MRKLLVMECLLLLLAIAAPTLLTTTASRATGQNKAIAKVAISRADPFLVWVNHGEAYKESYANKEGKVITYRILILETYRGYGVLCASAWDSKPNAMYVRILKGGEEVAYDEAIGPDVAYAEWPFNTFAVLTVEIGYVNGTFPAYYYAYLHIEFRG